MLKIYFYLCFSFLFITLSCKQETENTVAKDFDRATIIDSTINAFQQKLLSQQIDSVFSKTKFNGSISIVQDDLKLYEKANGFEDFKAQTKLDSNSVFAIGSVSKQFTAVMILILEDQGTLNTDDKVSKFLPEFQNRQFESVSVHQLLNHTSGISDLGKGLHSQPGKEFSYSNKGYRLLGEIIEKASGKTFDQNAAELFAKAGMKNSYTATSFTGNHLAGAYSGTSKSFRMIENMPIRLAAPSISSAAGGILSTVSDLHRWNDALYDGKILKPATFKKFATRTSGMDHPILGKVGYGFGIMMSEGKQLSYFHTGYVKGSPTLMIYYPETKTSVVILSNIADETKGKSAFFIPHKEVKKVTDAVQNAVAELRVAAIK